MVREFPGKTEDSVDRKVNPDCGETTEKSGDEAENDKSLTFRKTSPVPFAQGAP